MPAYTIRSVDGVDEADTLAALHRSTFSDADPLADFAKGWWWIAYFEGHDPVGFAGLHPSHREPSAGYLVRAGVLREHRGNNLQRRLLRVRERKARSLGWWALFTDTFNNPASANNLIKAGYRIFTPQSPWSFDGAIYWQKELARRA